MIEPRFMSDARIKFGKEAEEAACVFLKKRDYTILERNFRTRFGEIDIIARHGETLVFTEVKARKNNKKGSPREAVGFAKQQKIRSTASYFLRQKKITGIPVRFDVVSMMAVPGGFNIELIDNAF